MALRIQKRQTAAQTLDLRTDCTALYIRVSTDKQAEEGFSLDAQTARLHAYCTAQGWEVCPGHVYLDAGESGKTDDRPQFKRMMAAAQDGQVTRIVAVKLDRIARNTRDLLATVDTLRAVGCDLVLIKESFDTSTPHGKFALTLFAAMAELEASTIQERTMEGRRQKAAQGEDNGRFTPLGYTFQDGAYTPDQNAGTITRIFEEFAQGESMTAIARHLNADGHATARGGKWYAGTIKYILQNGFYAGLIQYDGGAISEDGTHPAIIDRDTYQTAIARIRTLTPGRQAA